MTNGKDASSSVAVTCLRFELVAEDAALGGEVGETDPIAVVTAVLLEVVEVVLRVVEELGAC